MTASGTSPKRADSPASRFSPALFALLLAVALFWGLNWPVMKIAIREIPPLGFRGFSLLLGGVGLLAIARLRGLSLAVPSGHRQALAWLAASNIVGWNAFSISAVMLLPSGRAALLGYTMPVWSVLLSALWLGERLTRRRLLGLFSGAFGVAAMMGAELTSLSGAPHGAVLMLLAAFCWALGIVSLKRFVLPLSPLVLSGWMMTLGGFPLALVSLLVEAERWRLPSLWPSLAFVYNVFIAVMFCYWAWNRIVLKLPVAVSSLSSLLIPLIGVTGGMLILGERPGWGEMLGAAGILGAVATVILPERKRQTVA